MKRVEDHYADIEVVAEGVSSFVSTQHSGCPDAWRSARVRTRALHPQAVLQRARIS